MRGRSALVEWAPIIIALIALTVSLYTAYLSRRSFIAAHRPYIWALSYSFLDPDHKTLRPVPSMVGYRVLNAPAKVAVCSVKIVLGERTLLSHTEKAFVRFPDANSEWTFSLGTEDMKSILDRPDGEKVRLSRAYLKNPIYWYTEV